MTSLRGFLTTNKEEFTTRQEDGGWLVQPSQASLLPASAPTRSRWMNGAQDVDLCQRLYSGPESESSSLAGGPTVHMGIANPGDEEEPSSN